MREWWSKLRALFIGRSGLADELREEMSAHLECEVQDNLARGMTPEEAKAAARRNFGNSTFIARRHARSGVFTGSRRFRKTFATLSVR